MDSAPSSQPSGVRYFSENNGPPQEWPLEPEPEPESPPPLTSEDLEIAVTIRISNGDGVLEEWNTTELLRALLSQAGLPGSESRVADLIGREVVEPIRALVRAELCHRFGDLPEAWLEGDPELIDWYEQCRRSAGRDHRVHDKLQWSRIHRPKGPMKDWLEEVSARAMSEWDRR
ncbi:MAG: hypothetical protein KDL87_05900 [Verrucomicrobiae bacterium]|nr:hypothetical protein [Verrucomicrobiae bacterium]